MGSIENLRRSALDRGIPIMMDDGIEFLTDYIKKNKVKNVLEIGTAIGYSAICMASLGCYVTSIERDYDRYIEAIDNVKSFGLSDKINLLFGDALDVDVDGKFDLIFIDGAKGQSIRFFEKYKVNMSLGGSIITDNLNFHGLVNDVSNIKSKNLKSLVKKIINYRKYLEKNGEYETKFYNIGDGISVSKKK